MKMAFSHSQLQIAIRKEDGLVPRKVKEVASGILDQNVK
jgi:hypothetical protein